MNENGEKRDLLLATSLATTTATEALVFYVQIRFDHNLYL